MMAARLHAVKIGSTGEIRIQAPSPQVEAPDFFQIKIPGASICRCETFDAAKSFKLRPYSPKNDSTTFLFYEFKQKRSSERKRSE